MSYLDQLLEVLFSVEGILGTMLGVVALVFALRHQALLVYAVSLPIFISCFGKYRWIQESFVFPLEQILTVSRPVVVISLGMVFLVCALFAKKASPPRPNISSIWLFLFHMVYAVSLLLHGDFEFGVLALATFSLSFAAVYALRSTLPRDRELAARSYCQAIVVAGAMFAFACLYQYYENPGASRWAGRFIGITNNAIHTAQFSVFFLLSTVALLYATLSDKKRPIFSVGVAVLCLVFCFIILATGSRTGIVMLAAGLVAMFRKRLGKFLIPSIFIFAAGFALNMFFADFEGAVDHLGSMQDSRSGLFRLLLNRFMENPIFGEMELEETGRLRIRESSYLTCAANLGLVGLVPLLLAVGTALRSAMQYIKYAQTTKRPLIFSDWSIGLLFAAIAGSITEGFLFAIIAPATILLHIVFSLLDSPIRGDAPQSSQQHDDAGENPALHFDSRA